jgi:hypothetical protein
MSTDIGYIKVSLLLEWLLSRTQSTTNAGRVVRKMELSYFADGNVN